MRNIILYIYHVFTIFITIYLLCKFPFTSFYLYFWRRKWQPTPVFLLGESHGQSSLVGCIQSMGSQESDTTQRVNHHHHLYFKNFRILSCFLCAGKQLSLFLVVLFQCFKVTAIVFCLSDSYEKLAVILIFLFCREYAFLSSVVFTKA